MPEYQLSLFPDLDPVSEAHEVLVAANLQKSLPVAAAVKSNATLKPAKSRASKVPRQKSKKVAPKASSCKGATDLLTVYEVAEHLTVSRATIWRWVKGVEGFPQPLRFARGTTRWRLQDVVEWKTSRAIDGPQGGGL